VVNRQFQGKTKYHDLAVNRCSPKATMMLDSAYSMPAFSIDGMVIQGLQAAGRSTLVRQMPHFQSVRPEMRGLHPATINLQLEGALRIDNPDFSTEYAWYRPTPEKFSFLYITLEFPIGSAHRSAWIYVPHESPHLSKRCQVEIISEKIEGLIYGSRCRIHVPRGRLETGLIVV
jgi:hypothetical protein